MVKIGSPYWLYMDELDRQERIEDAIAQAQEHCIYITSDIMWEYLRDNGIDSLSKDEFEYIQSKIF